MWTTESGIEIYAEKIGHNYSMGMACGPCGNLTVVRELKIRKNGKVYYLTSSWIDEAPDSIQNDVTAKSIYDYMNFEADDTDDLEALQADPEYRKMLKNADINEIFDCMDQDIIEYLHDRLGEDDSEMVRTVLGLDEEEEE